MRIRDVSRQVEFITEDPAIIKKAQSDNKDYEVVTEETAIEARRKSLDKMKVDDVIVEAGKFNIAPDAYKRKAEFIEAILEAEAVGTTQTAGNAA